MLDSNWQVLEQIPIDVGPRHFTVSGTQPALPDTARKGDRWASSNPQNGEVAPLSFLSSSSATLTIVHMSASWTFQAAALLPAGSNGRFQRQSC